MIGLYGVQHNYRAAITRGEGPSCIRRFLAVDIKVVSPTPSRQASTYSGNPLDMCGGKTSLKGNNSSSFCCATFLVYSTIAFVVQHFYFHNGVADRM